jgi:branched-chain amino acid transport system permease protein
MSLEAQLLLFGLNGLVWGLIIALIALGLSLVFGLIEIINIAHGDLFMLGAVLGWYVIQATGSFWLALAITPAVVGAFGILIERGVLRPIEHKPIITILATFGLSLILQQSVLATFGGAPQRIEEPIRGVIPLLGTFYPVYRLFVATCALGALGLLWLFLYRTRYGMWMRAVRQDREMAVALGIPSQQVYMLTFGLGAALAAFGGVLAAPVTSLEFQMGLDVLPTAFIVVIIGGLGSLLGTAVASVLLGVLEGLANAFVTPTTARIFSLVIMAVVLLVRPQGLFGRRQ